MAKRALQLSFLVVLLLLGGVRVTVHDAPAPTVVITGLFVKDALAAPSCTNWMRQDNGCDWRTCVDDNGSQYCEQSCNGTITRIAC